MTHAELRKWREDTTIWFVCAKCGGRFRVPEHPGSHRPDERTYTRIGGQVYCTPCARHRHHRSYDLSGLLGERLVPNPRKGRTGDKGEG